METKRFLVLLIIVVACNNSSEQKNVRNSKETKQQTVIDTKALAKKANLFYEQNNYLQAISSYDFLISIDSTKGGYYFKRGYCKSMLLYNIAAIADYKKAIERNYSEKKIAYLNIAGLYRIVLNKPDSAIYYYNEYLKIEPDNEKVKQAKEEAIESLKKLK